MGMKTILFTDIGNDVSSVMSLVYLATAPVVDLELVVTTSGNTISKAWVAKSILNHLNKDTRVAAGSSAPLHGKPLKSRPYEREGLALQETELLDDALRAVNGTLHQQQDLSVRVIVNAPFTDVAKSYLRDSELFCRKVNSVYVLADLWDKRDQFYVSENNNIAADHTATAIVEQLLPLTPFALVPPTFGINVPMFPEFFKKINPLHPVGAYIQKIAQRSHAYLSRHGTMLQRKMYKETQAYSLPHSAALALALVSPHSLGYELRESTGPHWHSVVRRPTDTARDTLENAMYAALNVQSTPERPRQA